LDNSNYAQMAELVDALVSGTSVGNNVQVRVLFWAQKGFNYSQPFYFPCCLLQIINFLTDLSESEIISSRYKPDWNEERSASIV
jgi:hypothetical protein